MILSRTSSGQRLSPTAAWISLFFLFSIASGSVQIFVGSDRRAVDFTSIFLLWPMATLVVALYSVWAIARIAHTPFIASLRAMESWLALLFVPVAVDGIFWMLGFVASRAYLMPVHAFSAFLSGGFYPRPIASLGTLLGLAGLVYASYQIARRLGCEIKKAIAAAGTTYVIGMGVLLAPSVLGWIGMLITHASGVLGPTSVRRGVLALTTDGYFWRSVFDRFPFAMAGEVEVGLRGFFSALLFLVLAPWLWRFVQEVMPADQGATPTWRTTEFGQVVLFSLFGILIAWSRFPVPLNRFSSWIALCVYFFVLFFAAWFVSIWDDRMRLVEAVRFLLAAVMVGSWILGWPVFLFLLSFLALRTLAEHPLFRTRQRLARLLVLGAANFAITVSGWLVWSQSASTGRFPRGLVLACLIGYALFAMGKERLDRDASVPDIKSVHPARQTVAALVLGFLVFPLLSGWFRWFLVAVPFAWATLFFLWFQPYSPRTARFLTALFFLVSGCLAASGWLWGVSIS